MKQNYENLKGSEPTYNFSFFRHFQFLLKLRDSYSPLFIGQG